jgi:hypothetical protein
MTFVFRKNGGNIVKQEVKLGLVNDNAAEVLRGVNEEDELLLSMPTELGKLETIRLAALN